MIDLKKYAIKRAIPEPKTQVVYHGVNTECSSVSFVSESIPRYPQTTLEPILKRVVPKYGQPYWVSFNSPEFNELD